MLTCQAKKQIFLKKQLITFRIVMSNKRKTQFTIALTSYYELQFILY